MTNENYEKLTKLKTQIDKIEGMLEMFVPDDNRYRLRKLFFPKLGAKDVKWGHSYGIDNVQFDLEQEDAVAIVEHFKKKLERLNMEFHSIEFT